MSTGSEAQVLTKDWGVVAGISKKESPRKRLERKVSDARVSEKKSALDDELSLEFVCILLNAVK